MCGVTGVLHFDGEPASPVVLRRMTDAIAHRGPDGEGQFVDGAFGLGHRRLAIIDLSPAGHQPMPTRGRPLRPRLQRRGVQLPRVAPNWKRWAGASARAATPRSCSRRWRSGGDAPCRASTACSPSRCGIAIEKTACCSRATGYGVKPLITRCWPTARCSSARRSRPCSRTRRSARRWTRKALLEYLTFQNFFTERTLFKGVQHAAGGPCCCACAWASPR